MADEQKTEPARTIRYSSPAHWRLSGDAASLPLDRAVELCVIAGLTVSFIQPGAYRVAGTMGELNKAADLIRALQLAPIRFDVERPPEGLNLRFDVRPDRPSPRVAQVHGQREPERPVARAIDAGLNVERIGIQHYRVTGPTRAHVAWMAALFEVSTERAMQIMQLTPAQAAAEDAASPLPPINVVLPVRETVSQITRDARGDITQVKQTERTIKA